MKRREDFLEDYAWLRSCGYTHDQIAERFGIQRESLEQQLRRYGCRIDEPDEVAMKQALGWLIDRGAPFTSEALPSQGGNATVNRALAEAVRAGRIVRTGKSKSGYGGNPTVVYAPVVAEVAS